MLNNAELKIKELNKLVNNRKAIEIINQEIEDLLDARKRLLDDQDIILIRLKLN